MNTVLNRIWLFAYRLMLFDLKYSLTRWLSVEKKSARFDENLIALEFFMLWE